LHIEEKFGKRLSDDCDDLENELGVQPQGAYATVRTRLDILEARINNPYAPAPNVNNPFYIGGSPISGVSIQDGYGDPTITLPLGVPGSLYLREDGLPGQGLYGFRPDGYWHLISFLAGGDLSATQTAQTVIGIQGNPVVAGANGASQDGYVFAWSNSLRAYHLIPPSSESITLGGDLSGTPTSAKVIGLDGYSLPNPGNHTGYLQDITGTLTWSPINLAGGSSYVIGSLPTSNQVAQSLTLTGDVTSSGGTTTSATTTVASISGASPINITPSALQWLSTTTTPKISQATLASGTGALLTLQAQNTSSGTGGALTLTSGSGTSASTAGNLSLQTGGVTQMTITPSLVNIVLTETVLNSSGSNPVYSIIDGYTSTNATIGVAGTFALSANTTYYVTSSVVAQDQAGAGDYYAASFAFVVSRASTVNSGNAVLNSTTPVPYNVITGGTGSNASASITLSTNTLNFNVTGISSTTLHWTFTSTITQTS
jgi:hypothetical protein